MKISWKLESQHGKINFFWRNIKKLKNRFETLVSNESPGHIILYISTNYVNSERNLEKDATYFLQKLIWAKGEVEISDVTSFLHKNWFMGNRVLAPLKIKKFLELQKTLLFGIRNLLHKRYNFSVIFVFSALVSFNIVHLELCRYCVKWVKLLLSLTDLLLFFLSFFFFNWTFLPNIFRFNMITVNCMDFHLEPF